MFARLALAYVLSLPLFVSLASQPARTEQSTLQITMSSSVPGLVQVFYDTGLGFSGAQSAAAAVEASPDPREYRLSIPSGRYRQLRLDPATQPGRYVILRVVVVSPDGATVAVLPLAALHPVQELTTIERTSNRLVVDAAPGATDPQILYAPAAPLTIAAGGTAAAALLGRFALIGAFAAMLVWLAERLLLRAWPGSATVLPRLADRADAHPYRAIVASALLATVLATYPLVFLGRSLVSPNNGPKGMLYDSLPFTPGSSDLVVEDTRGGDTAAAMYAFVPYSQVQREAIKEGEWPLWNRYNAAGRPLWGQGQTFLVDPLHWLTLVTPDPALGWDLKFVAHRLIFAIGVGLAAFAATGAWLPSAIAAFAAPFVGVYAYRVSHPASFVLTYAPWALFAWFRLSRARAWSARARAAVALAVASSLVLVASPPKEAAIMLAGVCATGTASVLMSAGTWADRLRRLFAAAIAGVAALLITAPHWLIFFDTLRTAATNYQAPFVQETGLPEKIAFVLGPLAPGLVLPGFHVLGFVLILAAVTDRSRLLAFRDVLACAVVAVVLMAVAFTVVPERWLIRVPLVANIYHVHDVFVTAVLPLLLVVSAAGAGALLAASRTRMFTVTAMMIVASWWLVARVIDLSQPFGFEPWAAGFVLTLSVMLPACLAASRAAHGRGLGIVASAAAVLVLPLAGGLHADSGLPSLDALLMQPRLRVPLDANSPAVESVRHAAHEPERALGVDWVLSSGSQAMYELEGLNGPDALQLPNYEELFKTAGVWRGWGWYTRVPVQDFPRLAPLLDLLNTGFLLARRDEIPPEFSNIESTGEDRLTAGRRTNPWPRAFFSARVINYSDAADLLRRVASSGQPFAAVQQSDRQAIDATIGLSSSPATVVPAERYRLTVNSTSFLVKTASAGVAVLGESFLPNDFRVTLNGRPVTYFRVNHAFKAVTIPSAGEWEVVFAYRPARWSFSLALCGLGVIVLASLGVSARHRRPPAGPASTNRVARELRS